MSPYIAGEGAGAPSGVLQELLSASKSSARNAAALNLASFVQQNGLRALADHAILDELVRAVKSKNATEREGAVAGFETLFRVVGSQGGADPYFVPLLPVIMERYQEAGKDSHITDTAQKAAKALIRLPPPEQAHKVIEELFEVIDSSAAKWKSKVGALELLATFATSAQDEVAERLGEYVPRLSGAMKDTKPEIASTAFKTAVSLCSVLTNPDIQPFVPVLVKCMADPTTVPDLIKQLSSTVWVREVDGPTLAVVTPLLQRALNERGATVQRQSVVLIGNLFKLVRTPDLAAHHAAFVKAGVERIYENAAFPEVRAFAEEALSALKNACDGAADPAIDQIAAAKEDEKRALADLEARVSKQTGQPVDSFFRTSLSAVAFAISHLVRKRVFDEKDWTATYVGPYLERFMPKDDAMFVSIDQRKHWMAIDKSRFQQETQEEDDEDGEPVVDLPFSLAYGGLLLLNHTTLKLRRGHRYGLCGANGCGKSTLLKAINRKQIDNFPEDLKAAYVEHDIDGDESGVTVVGLMLENDRITADEAEIRSTLLELGFSPERQDVPVMSLSGGWKMRVALCRAMLMKVDLLLLDEPTNHLDVKSVAWLQDYLNSQGITCLIVSHDSGFLDAVCTNIIHYHKKQLVYYKGNLEKFVEKNPSAKSYYQLSSSVIKFQFPPPGHLMGVRSRTRAILKMTDCTFTYPGAPKPQLSNVSCSVSLSSRIGIIGPNGAGKSTLIKLLVGETVPDSGRVEQHPSLRVAYVSQHAFGNISEHLDKTAIQYIQWRFELGYDREQSAKATRKKSPEEERQMKVPIKSLTDGSERTIERIIGRQKLKKSYTYEIKFVGYSHKQNAWIPRERLIELGFSKLIQEVDDFEASREGAGSRETKLADVRKHLEDVGLNGDIAQYNEIKGLSGGQKVKVVIAAAMWSKPQLLILDEPTNFLDRDALGGLAIGIKEWEGGFLCISHNEEFVRHLAEEIWHVDNGVLTRTGKIAADDSIDMMSGPNSAAGTPQAGTPGTATPAESTPAGSGDEARAAETIAGADEKLAFKAPKKKKMTRKQLKEREERRRLRTLKWLNEGGVAGQREADTDSDEDPDKPKFRIPSKTKPGSATPPAYLLRKQQERAAEAAAAAAAAAKTA